MFAILGESIADIQLYQSKKEAKTTLYQKGLWKFSRHPNYFFDILFWLSLSSYTFLLTKNIISFCSPILLYVIMKFITGKISEKLSLKKHGIDYSAYQKTTPMIIPIKLFIK